MGMSLLWHTHNCFSKGVKEIMNRTKKLTTAGILIALGVILSTFSIPIGVTKCFPIQHLINVLAAVILGPFYGVSMALITSLIRVMMGTGTLLAFPGSMCGALLAGLMYKKKTNIYLASLGEVFGTSFMGALIAYPMATLLMSKDAALFGFVIPFSLSSFVGAAIALVFLTVLKKVKLFDMIAN